MRDRPLQLMLIDEDPRFRLGLKVWLEQQGDFEVVAEAGKAEEAVKQIRSCFEAYEQSKMAALRSPKHRRGPFGSWPRGPRAQTNSQRPALPPIDLVLLDLGMGANGLDRRPGLQLCQQIKSEFPKLPVFALSAGSEPELQSAAKQAGASGYGTRSMSVRLLSQQIAQAAAQAYEMQPIEQQRASSDTTPGPVLPIDPTTIEAVEPALAKPSQREVAPESRTEVATPQPELAPSAPSPSSPPATASETLPTSSKDPKRRPNRSPSPNDPLQNPTNRRRGDSALSRLDDIPGPLTAMRISMRLSGLQQIDRNIAAVEASKQQTTSWLNRAILDGKKRELAAARWLVASIWRTPKYSDDLRTVRSSAVSSNSGTASTDWIRAAQQGGYGGNYADMTAARYLDREALVPNAAAVVAATAARLQARPSEVQSVVFEGVFAKLQRPLKNTTQSPLEIDILRADKKLELLYLVQRQLEDLLADLRNSNVQAGQLNTRSSQVIKDLWDAVNTEFFGKYYTVRVSNVEEEVVTLLQQEKPIVEAQILNKIPMVSELFGHWLFQEPMEIDGRAYDATTSQAIARSEQLLENLIIQVANSVIQPLLNRLSDTESIKKSLYNRRLMSSREIERFRNDLSWRYRRDRLVDEPQAIFESRYNLFVFGLNGIKKTSIYAPRRAELDRLKGLPLIVTLALETRDAIAPRLRTAFSLVGSSVVYVLTEVLGRGIGLVGRGVLKGVGNIRQEGKARQKKRQSDYSEAYRDRDDIDSNSYRERTYQDSTYTENPYSQEFSEWE